MEKVLLGVFIFSALVCLIYYLTSLHMQVNAYFSKIKRKSEAAKEGVPFKERMWYNYRAMLPKSILNDKSFIEIFDSNGNYIKCPNVGEEVIYNSKGSRYRYKIVGFDNDSPNRDWLYDSDYINPIVEYKGKIN